MTSTSISGPRERLGAAALVLAPLVVLVAALVHPTETSDAGRQIAVVAGALNRWYVAHLLYIAGFALLVPATLALGRRLRPAAPRLELWGTGLAVVGLFSSAGIVAVEGFGGWQLAQIADRAAAADALDRIGHSAGIVIPFGIVGLAFPVGLIVLAVGLARTRATAAWTAWVLGASAVLVAVGLAGAVQPVLIAGLAGLVVAMAAVGVADLWPATAGRARTAPARPTVGLAS